MRKDDALHDEHGNHRTDPPEGMSRARFDNEMRAHMEGTHLFWNYVTDLIGLITTEEKRNGPHQAVSPSRPSPRKPPQR